MQVAYATLSIASNHTMKTSWPVAAGVVTPLQAFQFTLTKVLRSFLCS